jgi:hypothetical protein
MVVFLLFVLVLLVATAVLGPIAVAAVVYPIIAVGTFAVQSLATAPFFVWLFIVVWVLACVVHVTGKLFHSVRGA